MVKLSQKLNSKWSSNEWEVFSKKLENLSKNDLVKILEKSNVSFQNSIDKVTKEEIILILDEIDRNLLISEYEKISGRKWDDRTSAN